MNKDHFCRSLVSTVSSVGIDLRGSAYGVPFYSKVTDGPVKTILEEVNSLLAIPLLSFNSS